MLPLHQILRLFLAAMLLGGAVVFLSAQTSSSFADFTPRFEVFELPGGAWGNSIQGMVQDKQGFLWFASQAGLHRYDGERFVTYRHDPKNAQSLTDDYIESIFLDSKNNIWVGYLSAGLSRFNPATNSFTHYRHSRDDSSSLSNDAVYCITEDSLGQIWVGTNYGLNRLDDPSAGKWTHFFHEEHKPGSLLHNYVHRLYVDKKGTLWIAAGFYMTGGGGLCRFQPGVDTFSSYFSEPGNPRSLVHPFVNPILEDSQGRFWVGTAGDGLHWMDRDSGTFIQWRADPKNPSRLSAPFLQNMPFFKDGYGVCFILEDQAKRVWIGSVGGGLNVYNPAVNRIRHFEAQPGIPGALPDDIGMQWIFQSRDGILWIGSGSGERVLKVDPEGSLFPFYQIPGLQNDSYLTTVLEDQSGYLWAGVNGQFNGLIRYDRKSHTSLEFPYDPVPGKLRAKHVNVLAQDRSGFLWIGTGNGLFKLDPKTGYFQHFPADESNPEALSCNWVYHILPDNRGNIWVATNGGGLNRLDAATGKFKRFQHDKSAPQTIGGNLVSSVYEDQNHTIWAGGGWGYPDEENPFFLDRLNSDGTFTHFAPSGTMGEGTCLSGDGKEGIWFTAGFNNGIRKFEPDKGSFTGFTTANSNIPSNHVNSLIVTKNGKIWMATDNALATYDPDSQIFQSYSGDYGIRVIGHGVSYRMCESAAGDVLLAGHGGFYAFFPGKLARFDIHRPSFVHITGLQVKGEPVFPAKNTVLEQPIWETGQIEFSHDQGDFSFSLSTFNYRNPGDSRVEYMLENYDNDWRKELSDGAAVYHKVVPGKYVFKTSSINSRGVRTEGVRIRIIISPPWWHTWWAYLLFAALFFAGIFSFYRFQLNRRLEHAETLRLQELDAVKTKLYTNITHEFRTPLTVILGMARQVLDNPKDYFRHGLDMIIRNGQNLLELVNQMLDLSKLESGKLSLHLRQGDVVNFLKYLVESFHSLAESKKIRIHFLNDVEALAMDFDAERLQQVVSNLLSNAVKFTPEGGHIYLSVSSGSGSSGQMLLIKVKDTGVGISEENLPHIFDRFYQADDTHTRHGEGTGIGLALAKELVKLMEGDITVKSTPGKGTEFTVTLPVRQTAEIKMNDGDDLPWKDSEVAVVNPSLPFVNQASAEKPLVLIAEDNADVVAYLASCLATDYRLAVAKDGQECEEMAFNIIPDLIVTDVMMPRKDGFEVCENLKNDERTSHIPIVMLTAKADTDSKLEGLERGADAYLMKPFHKEELLLRIKKLLELRQKLQLHYLSLAGLAEAGVAENEALPVSIFENAFVTKAREIVEAHLDDFDFDVEKFCRALTMSHPQVHRKLTALTGLSANKFIRSIRLSKAKSLLLNPELSITAVAFDSGFSDPSYFGKIFKQEFGLTPLEWRERQGA